MSKSLDIRSELRGKTHVREFTLDRAGVNSDERTIPLAFSSEEPVDRYFGREILVHDGKACDLSRLKNRAALLLNHDWNDQIGVVESCEIGPDKKGRAVVRFSKSPRGEEIFQDVKDGIRSLVSVGYEIRDVETSKDASGVVTARVTDWQPFEISIVSIPADTSVGVGRNHSSTTESPMNRNPILRETAAPSKEDAGAPAAAPQAKVEEIRAAERKAILEKGKTFRALCERHGADSKIADQAVNEDWSQEKLVEKILEVRYNAKPLNEADANPELGLSRKEIRNYSLVRALHARASGQALTGFEKECSDAVAKRTKQEPRGFFIPHDVAARDFAESKDLNSMQAQALAMAIRGMIQNQRTLTAGSATAGGITVGTDVLMGSMIELLRNSCLVASMGARVMSGLTGNIVIPKQAGGGTAYWLGETEEVTVSDQSFGQIALTPKKLGGYTKYSRELLKQSSIDVEAFVRQDLMMVLAIAKDLAAIAGGGVDRPLGILNTTGIGSVTFGAAPTWAKVVEFETTTETANALMGNLAWLTSPAVRGKWKTTSKVANTAEFLLAGDLANGYRFNATNQVASGKVIFGNWSDLILADWDGLDVTIDPYTNATTGISRTIMFLLTDSIVRQPASFTVSTDSGAQ